MEDFSIIELYWQRDERAIRESNQKYGSYCLMVAHNILNNREDSEECVSDTWLGAWNSIPPARPERLQAFFSKITRRLAIDRFRKKTAEKRGGGKTALVIEELEECTACSYDTETEFFQKEFARDLSLFLRSLPKRERNIFLRRYFFVYSTADIAKTYGIKESNVLVILSRTRLKLKDFLRKEGYTL